MLDADRLRSDCANAQSDLSIDFPHIYNPFDMSCLIYSIVQCIFLCSNLVKCEKPAKAIRLRQCKVQGKVNT